MKDEYRNIAPFYDPVTAPFLIPLRRAVLRRLAEFGPGRVLDACCGTGLLTRKMASAGFPAMGVDLSSAMLERAPKEVEAASFLRADVTRLPLADASFDCAVIVLALHENPRALQRAMLDEILRVLGPSGRLLVADYLPFDTALSRLATPAIHAVERAAGRSHYAGFLEFMVDGGLWGALCGRDVRTRLLGRHLFGTVGLVEIQTSIPAPSG